MSPRPVSRVVHLSVALVALAAGGHAAAGAVSHEEVVIKGAGTPDVAASVFTVDPAQSRIRVLTTQDLVDGSSGHHGISVREAADTALVGKVITKHALLFNGGYSDINTDVPVGLVVSDGAVVSLASHAVTRADRASACPFRQQERLRLSGVLCVSSAGAVSIIDVQKAGPEICRQALQAGPMLVEKAGEPAVCRDDGQTAVRTAVCIRHEQLLVVVTATPISLYALASWFAAPAGPDGLGCERALNLSGDASSGAVYFAGGLASLKNRFKAGPGTYPLPSLVLVQSRTIP